MVVTAALQYQALQTQALLLRSQGSQKTSTVSVATDRQVRCDLKWKEPIVVPSTQPLPNWQVGLERVPCKAEEATQRQHGSAAPLQWGCQLVRSSAPNTGGSASARGHTHAVVPQTARTGVGAVASKLLGLLGSTPTAAGTLLPCIRHNSTGAGRSELVVADQRNQYPGEQAACRRHPLTHGFRNKLSGYKQCSHQIDWVAPLGAKVWHTAKQ